MSATSKSWRMAGGALAGEAAVNADHPLDPGGELGVARLLAGVVHRAAVGDEDHAAHAFEVAVQALADSADDVTDGGVVVVGGDADHQVGRLHFFDLSAGLVPQRSCVLHRDSPPPS